MAANILICGHAHQVVGQDRLGFAPGSADGLPRDYRVRTATVAREAHEILFGQEELILEPGARLRWDATDYYFAGPEFGPGVGWHRFAVVTGELAGHCVAILVDDPLPPPDTFEPVLMNEHG